MKVQVMIGLAIGAIISTYLAKDALVSGTEMPVWAQSTLGLLLVSYFLLLIWIEIQKVVDAYISKMKVIKPSPNDPPKWVIDVLERQTSLIDLLLPLVSLSRPPDTPIATE